jgi:hypothetical protein
MALSSLPNPACVRRTPMLRRPGGRADEIFEA